MKKPVTKRRTKKQLQDERANRAYAVASEAMLVMHIEKPSVAVEVVPQGYFYRAAYHLSDTRMLVVTTIGVLAVQRMRDKREVESDIIYNDLLALHDPECFLDKLTVNEVMNMIHLTLYLLTVNWGVVEAIADKLLCCAQNQRATICLSPHSYSFTK